MTFLSLIIPCYNVSEYLPATLRSLTQLKDAEDCEFIFVNDGSTDNTLLLLTDFAKKDKRAIIIDQKNQGVSAARNRALEIAQGKYILCLDGDDCLHANTMIIIKENIHDSDALLSPCIFQKNGKNKMQDIHITNGIYSIEQLYKSCSVFPTAPMLVYSSTIIQRNQLQFSTNLKSGEVYDFTVAFFQHAEKVAVIDVGFYYYIMRNSSATHRPLYEADLTVLKLMSHFDTISQPWAKTTSFLLTEFKLITTFTYSKYIRNNLSDDEAIHTIEKVLSNTEFQTLITQLLSRSIDLRNKAYIFYLKYMPQKLGYLLLTYLGKIIKF